MGIPPLSVLSPIRCCLPVRTDNVRSDRAEEGVLRIALLDTDFFRQLEDLDQSMFSSPLLGKAYGELKRRWQEGRSVNLSALDGLFTSEELDHLSTVVQEPQPMHTAATALADYKRTILAESRMGDIRSVDDLASLRDSLKQKKSYGGQ